MKLIVELPENDYKALKEDGVQNHIALADTIIACSVPYEERTKGEWIENKGKDIRDHFYTCSICGRSINVICGATLNDYPFCHCGADMRGCDKE